MDDKTRIAILSRSFDLIDEIVCKCLKSTEEETRSAIKEEFLRRYDNVGDNANEKIALLEAYQKIEAMEYADLVDICDLLSDIYDDEEDISLREKFFDTEIGSNFTLINEDGIKIIYKMKLRFAHKERYFCMAFNVTKYGDEDHLPPNDFLEFIPGEHLEDDRIVEITDDEKELVDELSDVVADIYDSDNGGDN